MEKQKKMEKKKIKIYSEAAYLPAIILMALSVAVTAAADYGVSMIVAPAYILSLKIPHLTFGLAEYVVQGALFVVFCIIMKKVRLVYFTSFITGIIYGGVLDLIRALIPPLSADAVGTAPTAVRIAMLLFGMTLTSFCVALFFKIYIFPQVYDFFVKGLIEVKGVPTQKMKTGFDLCFLGISMILSFALFGALRGIGWGTALMTVFNGTLIALFERLIDRRFTFVPKFQSFAKQFELK